MKEPDVIRSSEWFLSEAAVRRDTCNDAYALFDRICRTYGLLKARQELSELEERLFEKP